MSRQCRTPCEVCGDVAVNALCASCAMFVRRYATTSSRDMMCRGRVEGMCSITKQTRKLCTKCRLHKCEMLGFKPLTPTVDTSIQCDLGTETISDQKWNYSKTSTNWTAEDVRAVTHLVAAASRMLASVDRSELTEQRPITPLGILQIVDCNLRSLLEFVCSCEGVDNFNHFNKVKMLKGCLMKLILLRGAINYDHMSHSFMPNTSADCWNITMDQFASFDDHALHTKFESFYSTFDSDWCRDVHLILHLMMTVAFSPTLVRDQRELASSLQCQWAERLKRYLINRHPHSMNKALCAYKRSMAAIHDVQDLNRIAAESLQRFSDDASQLTLDMLVIRDD